MAYDVFLSHASADKPDVEAVARRLREDGIEPFLDKWHLIPGEPWQEALEDALEASRTCAVFLGKKLGPWQNEEMRDALDERVRNKSYRVIPVLLPGARKPDTKKLPRFLRRLTWIDFRKGLDDDDAYRRLVSGIRGVAPGAGASGPDPAAPYRAKLPARDFFVQRGELGKVREILTRGAGSTIGITTAVSGAGGFGKTFRGLEPGTVLVTTRNVRTLPADTLRVDVDAMAGNEAVTLLGHDLPPVDEGRLAALAERLGEWPLLLRLVSSQLRKLVRDRKLDVSEALRRVESRLAQARLRAFDQRNATERSEAANLTIDLSLDSSDSRSQTCASGTSSPARRWPSSPWMLRPSPSPSPRTAAGSSPGTERVASNFWISSCPDVPAGRGRKALRPYIGGGRWPGLFVP